MPKHCLFLGHRYSLPLCLIPDAVTSIDAATSIDVTFSKRRPTNRFSLLNSSRRKRKNPIAIALANIDIKQTMNTAIKMIETPFTAGGVGTESKVPRDVSVSSVSSSSPSKTKRKSSSLPSETVEYLKAWMMSAEHIAHPYPTEQEKVKIMEDTDIELKQLTNWFVNNRKRYWKPRIEARLQDDPPVPPGSPVKSALIKPKEVHSPSLLGSLTSLITDPSATDRALDLTVDGTCDLTTQMTSSLYRLGSPARAISEQSSMASETGSVTSSQDQDDISAAQSTEEASVLKTESVTVRILRPVGGHEPSLEDVTILPNIPAERVVRSYDCCLFTYKLPVDISANRKKVRQRFENARLKGTAMLLHPI
jgi:hypothetical protein